VIPYNRGNIEIEIEEIEALGLLPLYSLDWIGLDMASDAT